MHGHVIIKLMYYILTELLLICDDIFIGNIVYVSKYTSKYVK